MLGDYGTITPPVSLHSAHFIYTAPRSCPMDHKYLVALTVVFFAASRAGGCKQNRDCNPPELANETIPPRFVSCSNNSCVCEVCFRVDSSTSPCLSLAPCQTYSDGTCYDHHSKKQLWAVLFSVFVSWTGAANFYINRLDLAIPQMAIGVLILVFIAVQFVHRQILKKKECGELLFYVCFAIAMLLCWVEIAWWIADVITFAMNKREDNFGCLLI